MRHAKAVRLPEVGKPWKAVHYVPGSGAGAVLAGVGVQQIWHLVSLKTLQVQIHVTDVPAVKIACKNCCGHGGERLKGTSTKPACGDFRGLENQDSCGPWANNAHVAA
jgi:hypothetical protein